MPGFGIGAKLPVFSVVIFLGYAFLAGLARHKIYQTIRCQRRNIVAAPGHHPRRPQLGRRLSVARFQTT